MSIAVKSRSRCVLVGAAISLCSVTSACEKLAAQQATSPERCSAAVIAVGSAKQCPTASLEFRISVAECERSSGTFDYEFTLVNQTRKSAVRRSSAWIGEKKELLQSDRISLACDDEILDVDNVRVTGCTCLKK